MSELTVTAPAESPATESPPLAAQPAREPRPDPSARLHELARALVRTRNRQLLVEFLQLRRALR